MIRLKASILTKLKEDDALLALNVDYPDQFVLRMTGVFKKVFLELQETSRSKIKNNLEISQKKMIYDFLLFLNQNLFIDHYNPINVDLFISTFQASRFEGTFEELVFVVQEVYAPTCISAPEDFPFCSGPMPS